MKATTHTLKNGLAVLIRDAQPTDAVALLNKIQRVASETDYLGFGAGEFTMTTQQEKDFLEKARAADNQLYLLAIINNEIAGSLNFAAGTRARSRHSGDFGVTVLKGYWGLGIGGLLLDTLIDWAKEGQIIKKIHLKVRTDNQKAISLYEKRGFVTEGTLKKENYLQGEYFDLYTMALFL